MSQLKITKGTFVINDTKSGKELAFVYTKPSGKEGVIKLASIKSAEIKKEWKGQAGSIARIGGVIQTATLASGERIFPTQRQNKATKKKKRTGGRLPTPPNYRQLKAPKITEIAPSEGEDNSGLFLPAPTQEILRKVIETCPADDLNYQYKLNRLSLSDKDQKFHYQSSSKVRNGHEEEMSFVFNRPNYSRFASQSLPGTPLGQIRQIKKLLTGTQKYLEFDFVPIQGVCIGLGDATVYETGLTLDFITGAPSIPASAQRGCMRNFILSECFEDAEEKALKNDLFRFIFGAAGDGPLEGGQKAQVTFWGGFAYKDITVEQDIINPHYQSHYSWGTEQIRPGDRQENKPTTVVPPGDWDMPIPVAFLRAKGTFKLFLSLKKDPELADFSHASALFSDGFSTALTPQSKVSDLLREWTSLTFFHAGIGAKTALGYGMGEVKSINQ